RGGGGWGAGGGGGGGGADGAEGGRGRGGERGGVPHRRRPPVARAPSGEGGAWPEPVRGPGDRAGRPRQSAGPRDGRLGAGGRHPRRARLGEVAIAVRVPAADPRPRRPLRRGPGVRAPETPPLPAPPSHS